MNPATQKVVIVDYGMGNLFSVRSACVAVGLEPVISADSDVVDNAQALILPGVGAFGDAIKHLRSTGLDGALHRAIERDVPVLAVCLGMQLLLEYSNEFGRHRGLGIVPGEVVPLREHHVRRPKMPHIGWSQVAPPQGQSFRGTPMRRFDPGDWFYFVHSYHAGIADSRLVVSETHYAGIPFCSSFQIGSVFACQFHPERSGPLGLDLYRSFFTSNSGQDL